MDKFLASFLLTAAVASATGSDWDFLRRSNGVPARGFTVLPEPILAEKGGSLLSYTNDGAPIGSDRYSVAATAEDGRALSVDFFRHARRVTIGTGEFALPDDAKVAFGVSYTYAGPASFPGTRLGAADYILSSYPDTTARGRNLLLEASFEQGPFWARQRIGYTKESLDLGQFVSLPGPLTRVPEYVADIRSTPTKQVYRSAYLSNEVGLGLPGISASVVQVLSRNSAPSAFGAEKSDYITHFARLNWSREWDLPRDIALVASLDGQARLGGRSHEGMDLPVAEEFGLGGYGSTLSQRESTGDTGYRAGLAAQRSFKVGGTELTLLVGESSQQVRAGATRVDSEWVRQHGVFATALLEREIGKYELGAAVTVAKAFDRSPEVAAHRITFGTMLSF